MPWPVLSFITPYIKPSLRALRKVWIEKFSPSDCTCEDLKCYILEDLVRSSPKFNSLQVSIEGVMQFRRLDDFISVKLFEGKVKAWGKETKNDRVSPKETPIPQEYWEFNKIVLGEETIDRHSEEEILYEDIRFNHKEMAKQIELFFDRKEWPKSSKPLFPLKENPTPR